MNISFVSFLVFVASAVRPALATSALRASPSRLSRDYPDRTILQFGAQDENPPREVENAVIQLRGSQEGEAHRALAGFNSFCLDIPIVGTYCDAGLTCAPFVQKCFHWPRRQDQPCALNSDCQSGLTCQLFQCKAPPRVGLESGCLDVIGPFCEDGLSCAPLVQKCYNMPRLENQPCATGADCAQGLACSLFVCKTPPRVGFEEGCLDIIGPFCEDGFSCAPFVQKCYHSPRKADEPCALSSDCSAGLSCQLFQCKPPKAKLEEACADLIGPTCEEGLSCAPVVQKCFHSPRKEGEPCAQSPDCSEGLLCELFQCKPPKAQLHEACVDVLGPLCGPGLSCAPLVQKCYHSPRIKDEPCSPGHDCADGLACEAFKCKPPKAGLGDTCVDILGPICEDGFSCAPVVQKCYHSPRKVDEPCALSSDCAAGLSCQFFQCKVPVEVKLGEECWDILGPFCEDGLSCHPLRQKCFHSPRLENEPCDDLLNKCQDGLTCQLFECKKPAKVGLNQACVDIFGPFCEDGLSCAPFAQKCYHWPRLQDEPCALPTDCKAGLTCQLFQCKPQISGVGGSCFDIIGPFCEEGLTCAPIAQSCAHTPRWENEPCALSSDCSPGLSCDLFQCKPPTAGFEETCFDVAFGPFCTEGLSCAPIFQKCYHHPRWENEPCADPGYSCTDGFSCHPALQRCYHHPRWEGEPCMLGYPCKDGLDCDITCKAPEPTPTPAPTATVPTSTPMPVVVPSGPTPAPSVNPEETERNQKCLSDTRTVLLASHSAYSTAGVNSVLFNISSEVTPVTMVEDFTSNQDHNRAYKIACEETHGGKYVALNYEAQCTNKNSDGNTNSPSETAAASTIALMVTGHPRCYASSCQDSDSQILFEKLTLAPTERRAAEHGEGEWICSGKLLSQAPSGCLMETALVKKQRNVILTDGAVKPTVKPKKWLFIKLSDQIVSWPQSTEYETACKENGGKFVKSDKEVFRCGETPYEVSNFGTCVGGSLCLENTTSYHETIGEIFKMKMIEDAGLTKFDKPELKCTRSGALRTSVSFACVTILSTAWYLMM